MDDWLHFMHGFDFVSVRYLTVYCRSVFHRRMFLLHERVTTSIVLGSVIVVLGIPHIYGLKKVKFVSWLLTVEAG